MPKFLDLITMKLDQYLHAALFRCFVQIAPTLHIELVGDPEVILQSWMADHTSKGVALDVACGLPDVAHLSACCSVDIIE